MIDCEFFVGSTTHTLLPVLKFLFFRHENTGSRSVVAGRPLFFGILLWDYFDYVCHSQ